MLESACVSPLELILLIKSDILTFVWMILLELYLGDNFFCVFFNADAGLMPHSVKVQLN